MSGHRVGEATTVNLHFYAATKHAVTAITEGIRQELRDMKSNVRVTVSVCEYLSTFCVCVCFFKRLSS